MAVMTRSNSIKEWMTETDWWVVKGTTGSGKTFFVEQIKVRIAANRWPVIYVPQFPIFKPQLKVEKFINLLPLSDACRRDLFSSLDALDVPTTGMIGGKFLGMLNLPGLSGGQRKKMLVAISVAMAKEFQCPFIVLDEPFAGVDKSSMPKLLELMATASESVPNLKYIIVTHDHFELLPRSARLLLVADRKVTGQEGRYQEENFNAAKDFAEALLLSATATPKERPFFDTYIVKRHFVELEFMQPLFAVALFGCLLALVVVNYEGSLPGLNKDTMYVFMTGFMLDYPNFGSLMNLCFKRAQHMEDFYLNITANEYAILETFAIVLIQSTLILAVGEAIMCGISSFWWISFEAIFCNWVFFLMDSFGFLLAAIVFPNPMIANIALLPYAIFVLILNGIMLPQDFFWPGIKWAPVFSPTYHFGCAYTGVTDKIVLAGTDCQETPALHIFFMNPFMWLLVFFVLLKVIVARRRQAPLKIDLSCREMQTLPAAHTLGRSSSEVLETQANESQASQKEVTYLPKLLGDAASINAKVSSAHGSAAVVKEPFQKADTKEWVARTSWWVVKGATGSGKTFFVEALMSRLRISGRDVVFVPQYPMFKPQLPVKRFLNMLPVSKAVSAELVTSLEEMAVPMSGLVGGALYGMLNIPGLSGGQRKKMLVAVSVAIATQYKCPFIIMDEPFAGIDAKSMEAVINVLRKAEVAVPGLKFIIVTHDHFDTLASSSSVLRAEDRSIMADNGLAAANDAAAAIFNEAFLSCSSTASFQRPWVDFYVVKRYFVEQEFLLPLFSYVIFGILMGLTMTNSEVKLPGLGLDVVYVFMKMFTLEFPHFASVINYCFKRGQHLEDYHLNITSSKYCFIEVVIISVLQSAILVPLFNLILCGVCDFWWINMDVALIDLYYVSITTVGYFLLPILCPNPILALASVLPYVTVWGFTNGIIFPKSEMWEGVEWTTSVSAVYNIGCAYKKAAEGEIVLQGVDCSGSLGLHLLLSQTFTWVIILGCTLRMFFDFQKDKATNTDSSQAQAKYISDSKTDQVLADASNRVAVQESSLETAIAAVEEQPAAIEDVEKERAHESRD